LVDPKFDFTESHPTVNRRAKHAKPAEAGCKSRLETAWLSEPANSFAGKATMDAKFESAETWD